MALPPIPTISPLPEPPIRGTDTGPVFSNKTATFIDALHDDFQPELNATVGAINSALPTIEAGANAASDAEAARDLAQGYASDAEDARDLAQGYASTATTQAGIAVGAASDAEDARDTILNYILPNPVGNDGKFIRSNGTGFEMASAAAPVLLGTLTSTLGTWEFTGISALYSELWVTAQFSISNGSANYFQVDVQSRGLGTWAGYARIGSGTINSPGPYRAQAHFWGTLDNQGPALAHFSKTALALNLAGSTFQSNGAWDASGGISGIRIQCTGTATTGLSGVEVKLWGRV